MRRTLASHCLTLDRTTVRWLVAVGLIATVIAGVGVAVWSSSRFARSGILAWSSPAGPGADRIDPSRLSDSGAAANRTANINEARDESLDVNQRHPIERPAAGIDTALNHAALEGRSGAAQPLDQKGAASDANQGDAALFAAWERLERRVAAAMIRARDSVVALEYTPADAAPGARRMATGVVINQRGDILSVRIDRPAAGTPSGDPAAIVARDATGRRHAARWIAADVQTGLTLLRVASRVLKPIRTAADEPEVGAQVFVVGNPFGMGHSVSRGYVAGLERTLELGSRQLGGLMQIQTPLYPGDSGAAVVNIRGEWLGMIRSGLAVPGSGGVWTEAGNVTSAASHATHASTLSSATTPPAVTAPDDDAASGRPDPDNGFGFAIPTRDALWVADQLRGGGRVDRAYLGVRLDMGWNAGLDPAPSTEPGPNGDDASSHPASVAWSNPGPATSSHAAATSDGAVLQEVLPDTPAASGGLRPGDLIVSINGQPIHSAHELTDRLDRIPARTTIELGILRGTGTTMERIELSLRTVSRPRSTPAPASRTALSAAIPPSLPATAPGARTLTSDHHTGAQPGSVQVAQAGLISHPSQKNDAGSDSPMRNPVVGDRPEPAVPSRAPGQASLPPLNDIRIALPRAIIERVEQLERRLERLERVPIRRAGIEPLATDAARSGQAGSGRSTEAAETAIDPLAPPRPRP